MSNQEDTEKDERGLFGEETIFSLGFLDESLNADYSGPEVPEERGPYILKNKIGSGGQGEVWEAWQTSLKRKIAVKISRRGSKSSFLNEAILTAELDHPNIVPVLDLGSIEAGKNHQNPDALVMAMKRVNGTRWDELIRQDFPKDDSEVHDYLQKHLEILRSICHAVAYAHSRKIVHLDLKPSQVIVGSFGEVFLMDWGLAARLEEFQKRARQMSNTRGAFGTPSYMAPEQAIADYQSIGIATDVYLLGATAFHLVTGSGPHPGDNENSLLYSANMNRIGPVPEFIPEYLQSIILKALSTSPQKRFGTVEEFRRSLEKFLGQASHRKEAKELFTHCEEQFSELSNPEYKDLEMLERRLNSAISMSPSTDGVHKLKDEVLVSHVKLAVEKDDLELARLITGRINEDQNRTVVEEEVVDALEERLNREVQRRKSRQIAMIAMVMLVFVMGISGYLLYQSFLQTESQRERAEMALVQSQQELARSSIQAASSHIENQRYAEARQSLRQTPKSWRGPEWGYLASMSLPEMKLLRPRSEVYSDLTLSGDGEYLAAIDISQKNLLVHSLESDTSEIIQGQWSAINSARKSILLVGDENGTLLIFENGKLSHEIRCSDSAITHLAMFSDNSLIVADSVNQIWKINTEYNSSELFFTTESPVSVMSTNREFFAIGTESGKVWHGRLSEHEALSADQEHDSKVQGVSWFPLEDGLYSSAHFLSWAYEDGVQQPLHDERLFLHQAGIQESTIVVEADGYAVTAAAWSSSGNHIVIGNSAAFLHEIEAENWQLSRSVFNDSGIARNVGFMSDHREGFSVTRNNISIRKWEWFGMQKSIQLDSRQINDLLITGSEFIACGPDGGICLYSSQDQADAIIDKQFPNRTMAMEHSAKEAFMITGHQIGSVRFWNSTNPKLELIQEHWINEPVYGVSSSTDALAAIAQLETEIVHYRRPDPDSEFKAKTIKLPGSSTTVSMHKNGLSILAALDDGRVFSGTDYSDFSQKMKLEDILTASTSHEDHTGFIAGTEDGDLIVLSEGIDQLQNRLQAHDAAISFLTFDSEGKLLLSGSEDETAKLWDYETLELLGTYRGTHSGLVTSGIILPDEGRIITANRDSGIRFFDMETEIELIRFTKHQYGVLDVVQSPVNHRFYSTGQGMSFRTWLGVPWDEGDHIFDDGVDQWRQ